MEKHRRWEVQRCRCDVTIVWAVWCGEVDGRVMHSSPSESLWDATSLEVVAGETGRWTAVQVEPGELDCA